MPIHLRSNNAVRLDQHTFLQNVKNEASYPAQGDPHRQTFRRPPSLYLLRRKLKDARENYGPRRPSARLFAFSPEGLRLSRTVEVGLEHLIGTSKLF